MASTTQATWLVQEVINHYLREGSHPVIGVLDCSRAFDMARWDKLFHLLLEVKKVPPIVVRTLIFMYEEQYAWVRWGDTAKSERFKITNGTRQGSMASPALWSVYCDPLLGRLRLLGVGCHVNGLWMSAQMYCDDLIILAPNRRAMVLMLNEVEKWAAEYGITFSTDVNVNMSKSKLIYVTGNQPKLPKPAEMLLCGGRCHGWLRHHI